MEFCVLWDDITHILQAIVGMYVWYVYFTAEYFIFSIFILNSWPSLHGRIKYLLCFQRNIKLSLKKKKENSEKI